MASLSFALFIIGAISCIGLVAGYTYYNRGWWKNDISKMIITVAATEALLYLWFIVIRIHPRIPYRSEIGLAIFSLTTLTLLFRFITYIRLQRKSLREDYDGNPQEAESDT